MGLAGRESRRSSPRRARARARAEGCPRRAGGGDRAARRRRWAGGRRDSSGGGRLPRSSALRGASRGHYGRAIKDSRLQRDPRDLRERLHRIPEDEARGDRVQHVTDGQGPPYLEPPGVAAVRGVLMGYRPEEGEALERLWAHVEGVRPLPIPRGGVAPF